MTTTFDSRLLGCLLGVAIGDGMGGPVEGLTATEIQRRFPTWDWTRFLPTQEWKPKGEGRITDDTLMTEALIRAYNAAGTHLDAYGFRDFLLPEMCDHPVWVPTAAGHGDHRPPELPGEIRPDSLAYGRRRTPHRRRRQRTQLRHRDVHHAGRRGERRRSARGLP